MNILITGGAGYIGSTLAPMLLDRGEHVRVYDSLLFGVDPILPLFRRPRFSLVEGDVGHAQRLRDHVDWADAIIHLAALVGYPACRRDVDAAWRVNSGGTETLAALAGSKPVIFASTGSVYGAVTEGVCTEETPARPLTVYGETKDAAEQWLMRGGNAVIYRFATAFGLSPRMRLDLLVNDFTYQAVQGRSLVIYEADFMRTFIHVHDIARALIHALNRYDTMRGGVFNCGGNHLNASKRQLATMIAAVQPFYAHYADVGKDEDQRNYAVSYDKLLGTGFEPTVSLEGGIEEMARAFQHLRVRNPYSNVAV